MVKRVHVFKFECYVFNFITKNDRKDTRTCRQEAKRGQCLPGFDCFERNHPSLDAHMGVWDSLNQLQQERRGSGPDAVQIS